MVFASDYQAAEFLPGCTLILAASFADGSTELGVRLAHVEAGLRRFDRTMPDLPCSWVRSALLAGPVHTWTHLNTSWTWDR